MKGDMNFGLTHVPGEWKNHCDVVYFPANITSCNKNHNKGTCCYKHGEQTVENPNLLFSC